MLNLQSLIGLSLQEAEKIVLEHNLVPDGCHEKEIRIATSLPDNVVLLTYNDLKIVTNSDTQQSIDARYAKNY